MCGLFGEFGSAQQLLDRRSFLALNALSKNRGPNSTGYYCLENKIQLGFNRLAILDLTDTANQPFHSRSGRFSFVFNGEIYNHLELRSRFFSQFEFKGNSDTETLGIAFDEWGVEITIERLDGMFGMAVFDHQLMECLLIRDFAGIKPLHYGLKSGMLVFASQYDQVAKHPLFRQANVDQRVLNLYLNMHYVPSPFGILEDTFQVNPGEIIRFNLSADIEKNRYWEMPVQTEGVSCHDIKEGMDLLECAISEGVQSEMLSDVPLGTFLSGGIDSPLVTFFAQRHCSNQIASFSIGSDSKMHDESKEIGIYSKELGVQSTLKKLNSKQILGYMSHAMKSLKEPFGDPSILPTYIVSQLAAKDVTVVLSGDGGDELFFGYERFWSLLKNLPYLWIPHVMRYPFYAMSKLLEKNRHISECFLAESLSQSHRGLHSRGSEQKIRTLFPDFTGKQLPEEFDVYNYPEIKDETTMLGYLRRAEFYGMMQKTLFKVDRASMAHSLEVRVPLLKKSVINSSLKLSPYLSYGPGKKKEVLKKLLKHKVPAAPIDNRKRGFSVPLGSWINQELYDVFHSKLGIINEFGGVSDGALSLLEKHSAGESHTGILFTLFSLVSWWEEWQK